MASSCTSWAGSRSVASACRRNERRGGTQLALSTWQKVQEYLRGSHGIIVPIGSVE